MLLSALLLSISLQQGSVQLDLPSDLPAQFSTVIELRGQRATLLLQRRSLRASDFVLKNSNGDIAVVPESRTYFGTIKEIPGACIAASLEARGLRATIIMPDALMWRLQPDERRANGWHTLAVAADEPLDMCGVDHVHLKDGFSGNNNRANMIPPPSGGSHYLSPYPWQWKMRKSRIGFDATYDHWLREGQTVAGVTASVEYQLAENDLTCSRDAMVSYELTGIVIRQTPYYVGTTSGALLSEFANEWATNQQQIPYESAVLLADYQNDGIAGLAYVGTLGSWGYAGLFWDRGYSPGIIAHEIGHNWGAGHIDCWPWGGSAMCGSWLLYGPESTDIIQWRAAWLNLPVILPYETSVRPYANPDWVTADPQLDTKFDVLDNDYDANFDYIHISDVDATSVEGASVSILSNAGPGGRDLILYQPDRNRRGSYSDTFWYTAADFNGLEHATPVTIEVVERNLVAAYKFEEGSGSELLDSSGNGNDITASGPPVYAELNDPLVGAECNSSNWEPSSNLFDNSATTAFASLNQGVVSASFTTDPADGTWLEFDFGSTKDFEGFRHLDQNLSSKWIGKSVLWFSNDSTFDVNDISVDIEHHSHLEFVTYPFAAISARFVRWEVTEQHNPASTQYSLGGNEMAFVYNTQMVGIAPPLITLSSNAQAASSADDLIDNDINTAFISDSQGKVSAPLTRTASDGTWVEFDYQSIQNFEGASLLDLDNSGAFTTQSRLWFSNSSTFSTSDPVEIWNHGNQEQLQVKDFSPIQARYVRWEISDTTLNFIKDNGARELQLFSDLASNPPFQRSSGPSGEHLKLVGALGATSQDVLYAPVALNQAFTMNVLVQPDANLSDGSIICGVGNPEDSSGRFFEMRNNSLHFAGIDLAFSPATTSFSMLTASYDGSTLSVYHDATLLGSFSIGFAASDADIHLAPQNPNVAGAYYHGLIDEYVLWDYAFDANQVMQLFSGGSAMGPSPFDTQRNVDSSPRLSWTAALNAPQHDVYLSTDFYSTQNATPSSSSYLGRYTTDYVDLSNLTPGAWYYWRVDEIHANGDVLASDVWRFKTHLPWTTTVLEGFSDGNSGDHLDGLAGGNGFGAPWAVPAANGYIRTSGSLNAFPSNLPFTEVDGYLERTASPSLPMEGQRLFDSSAIAVDLSSDSSIYLSFAAHLTGTSTTMSAMVGLLDSGSGNTIVTGIDDGKYAINGAAGDAMGSVADRYRTKFIVVRIDANNLSNDEIYMKVYDSATELVHASDTLLSGIGSGSDQWTLAATNGNADDVFDHLFIRAGGVGSALGSNLVRIDEIRIGGSWSDITGL
ncbi:MAG: hypothetical protein ACI84O_000875 [Myxococcota bacterium]|jgi:hypothetical protein